MTWIKTITFDKASGKLKKLYDRIKGPDDNIDNIMLAHSLRPNTMEGHMALYKNVLHHSANKLAKSYLEVIGVYVSIMNDCDYCMEHHFTGLCRHLQNDEMANKLRGALVRDEPENIFQGKELAGLRYVKKLTNEPSGMEANDLDRLRRAGFDDGEILELNQVAAYFAYANRTVLGLGINTDGDVLGLSPGDTDDANNWSHS